MTRKRAKPVALFIGDLHCGSDSAPAPVSHITNRNQTWLLEKLKDVKKRVTAIAKTKPIAVMLGGDLIEGHHHSALQVWGNFKGQRDAAVELLMPFANIATWLLALPGTDAHAGDDGEHDRTVAEELGADIHDAQRMVELGGRLIDWAHHGISVGGHEWTEENGLISVVRDVYSYARNEGLRVPDLIISHHAHYSPHPVVIRGITAAICPCWQLQTPHGAKIKPRRRPTIGAALYDTETGLIDLWTYAQAQSVTHL